MSPNSKTRDVPLFRVSKLATMHASGTLAFTSRAASHLRGFRPDWLRDEFAAGQFPGIPWFLDDQRPQGFLGRQLARCRSAELTLPSDVTLWSDDMVLDVLLEFGSEGTGNFVIGSRAAAATSSLWRSPVLQAERQDSYSELALAALSASDVSSLAAGEQPKFTTTVLDKDGSIRHIIVKFSEAVENNPTARRWADLLICEHLASELLREQGDTSSRTELIWSHGRLCLEVTRFDRIGPHGRRGCVSLAAWSDAHDGERDGWPGAVARMDKGGWVAPGTLEATKRRWWFGLHIANTDMHFGNLSFFLDDALPLGLTPSYDMLPMLYRPASNGAVLAREYRPAVPTPGEMDLWAMTAGWAQDYWERVAAHDEVSIDFRQIAASNAASVARSRQRFDPAQRRPDPIKDPPKPALQ